MHFNQSFGTSRILHRMFRVPMASLVCGICSRDIDFSDAAVRVVQSKTSDKPSHFSWVSSRGAIYHAQCFIAARTRSSTEESTAPTASSTAPTISVAAEETL